MLYNHSLMNQLRQGAPGMQRPGTGVGAPDSNINPFDKIFTKHKKKPDPALPYFEEDRQRLGGLLNGHNPFAGEEWGGLISQLQGQANGTAPSLAEAQYRGAAQDTANSLGSMSRGSTNPGAARQAMIQQGRVGQGLAAGVATAGIQERQAGQSALAQALQGRDSLNQNAYLDVLAKQLGLSKDQMEALLRNEDREAQKKIAADQAKAAKYSAAAGAAGSLAGLL